MATKKTITKKATRTKKTTAKKATKKRVTKKAVKKPNCFIIMPFGGWFDKYYKEIYIEAIENAGFEANRADDLYRPGNIVSDIWKYTKEADVVLADLTNKNPNVFYELGLAHAITKPAVLITASMDDVPFDLRSLRVLVYDKNAPDWGKKLKISITNSLKETLENPEDALPSTFLDTQKPERLEISPEERDIIEMKREIDMLKREFRSNRKRPRPEDEIRPTLAKELIRKYLDEGYDDIKIASLLESQGPPIHWTLERIKEMKV